MLVSFSAGQPLCIYQIPVGEEHQRGAEGLVNLGDVTFAINYLYKSGPAPDPLEVGDANCDGTVDIGDVIYLINYLFKEGPPPSC